MLAIARRHLDTVCYPMFTIAYMWSQGPDDEE